MRKLYLDNIKWITVVLVVIYHVIFMFNAVERDVVIGPFKEVQYQDAYQYVVYPWFMLLLFVVSGMTSRYELQKRSVKEFIKTRTVRYIVPSTIGLFVFYWILGYFNMRIGVGFDAMGAVPKPMLYIIMALSGCGVMWYIQLLWVYSLLLIPVRAIDKDRFYKICGKSNILILLALTIVIFVAAQILNTPIVSVYRIGIYGAGFFIGYFVLSHEEVTDRLMKYAIPLGIVALALAVVFTVFNFGKPYAHLEILKSPLCNLYAWIACLAIIACMKKWGNISNPFTVWMSNHSWGLYLFHYLPLTVAAFYLKTYATGMPVVVIYLLCALASFAGGYLLYAILGRIPFIRWCVCGISKKKQKGKN